MPRRKKSKNGERVANKKQRLSALTESTIDVAEERTSEEIIEEVREMSASGNPIFNSKKNNMASDEYVFKLEKNALQKELDSFKDPVILETPDFLTDPDMTIERRMVLDKIKYLLKRRFSLITIADILETNDYSRLDEIISRKDETYKSVEKYTQDEADAPLRLFSGFKKAVGDDYSRTYSEQEDRVRAAINILYEGTYFDAAEQEGEKVETYLEDIIANIIDNPEFNLACQIESQFVISQLEKAITTLSELRSRQELEELIEKLNTLAITTAERAHAYDVMDKLMTGKGRKIISNPEEGER